MTTLPLARIHFTLFLFLLTSLPAVSQDHVWRDKLNAGSALTVGINPLNPNTVYAEGSSGPLVVSHDKGFTWSAFGSSPGLNGIRQIVIHPSDTLVIFCVAFFGGLQRSPDYGQTWTDVLPGLGIDGESIAINPAHPDTMFFGNFSDGAVYRSTDRGLTWEFRSSAGALLCSLVSRPDSPGILYAGTGGGTISKSTDGGLSWKLVLSVGSEEFPKICIDPDNPLVAYGASYDGAIDARGVWKTTDGGEQWVKVGLEGISVWAMDIDRNNPLMVYAGLFGSSKSAVYRTTDGGATWDTLSAGLPQYADAWSLKVHPLDPDMLWLAAGSVYRWTPSIGTIQGALLDAATADTIANGSIEITSTGDRFLVDDLNKQFTLHTYEGDPTLSPTAHATAFPFYPGDAQVTFIADSVVFQDIGLTRLPVTSIVGSVLDSNTQTPLSAEVVVNAATPIGDVSYAASTENDGSFEIDSLYISYPGLVSYESIVINPTFPYSQQTIASPILDSTVYVLNVLSDTADVLITSSQGSGDFTGYYATMLNILGLEYAFWNPVTEGVAPLSRGREMRKGIIIYYTGIDASPLPGNELDSLSTALQWGVHMLITGQNFVENNATSFLVSQTFGVSYGGSSSALLCRGVTDDLFSGLLINSAGGSGADNQTSRDIVLVEDSLSIPVIGYGFYGADGVAAIRRDDTGDGARVLLFGFGFEAINAVASREAVLRAVIGYLDGSIVLGIEEKLHDYLPLSYRLEQNYPNPFNPNTAISYQLSAVSQVSLKVFDLLGREVATLVNEKQTPGNYSVRWDAARQSSGVYFYRLQAGAHVFTKRLVVLK